MEQRIKERLIGAAALVVVVVIVVPALLTGPRPASAQKPSADEQALRTVTIDLAAGERGPIVRPPPVPSLPPVAELNEAEASLVPAPHAESVATPVAAPTVSVAVAESRKVERPKAESPKAQLPTAVPAKPESSKTESPKVELAKAESPKKVESPKVESSKAESPKAESPKAAAAVVPKVVSHTPVLAAKPTPGKSAGSRWVVQAGSFTSRDRAQSLANALKAKGYKPLLTETHTAGGTPVFRVRLAADKDRAHAGVIASRLSKEGHPATVVSQP
jgi:cell division septation protein DedD